VSSTVVVVVEAGPTVVEVVGAAVVVVGRTDEVVELVAGLSPAVAAGNPRGRGRVVVEEAPANRPRCRRVVEEATCSTGASPWASPSATGAVTNPSRLPPPAPSSTATTSIAHRRSTLNRTNAPARVSRSDDKRVGNLRPIFSIEPPSGQYSRPTSWNRWSGVTGARQQPLLAPGVRDADAARDDERGHVTNIWAIRARWWGSTNPAI
jgi:hypothetical protein